MTETTLDQPIHNGEIMELINQNCPDIVLPGGHLCQRNSAAIMQSIDNGAMSATFAIVTRTKQPNRYGNQLQLMPNEFGKGPQTQYYKQNPVVLYDHGMSGLTLPIGLASQDGKLSLAWSEEKGIGTCYFSKQSWAEPIYAAVAEGLLRMASIGFDPILAMSLSQKGPAQIGDSGVRDMTWLGMDFVEWELLEWSVVPIGADRGSLRQCLDRGKIHDVKLPQFLRKSFEQHAAKLDRPGIGIDVRRLQLASVTIEGPTDEVDAIEAAVLQAKAVIVCKACNDTGKIPCKTCGMAGCGDCGGSGKVQCMTCKKQNDSSEDMQTEPEPDIAPDTAMAYPSAADVAQACSAQLMQSQVDAVKQGLLGGVSLAVKAAIDPIAKSVANVAAEFQRMTGKIND